MLAPNELSGTCVKHITAGARASRGGRDRAPVGGVRRSRRASALGEPADHHVAEHRPVVLPSRPGSRRSRPKRAPKVWRLATRKTQNALIIMWTSIASTSARKTPSARPRCEDLVEQRDDRRAAEVAERRPATCSAWWMFSMLTSRMKSGCASWWSKVSSATRRIAATGSRCRRRAAARPADLRVRALQHGDDRAAPCRRSSSRSSAWWCG